MRYRLQRHDGTDCSATMVPITVLRMVPIQRYRQSIIFIYKTNKKSQLFLSNWDPSLLSFLKPEQVQQFHLPFHLKFLKPDQER